MQLVIDNTERAEEMSPERWSREPEALREVVRVLDRAVLALPIDSLWKEAFREIGDSVRETLAEL